MLNLSNERELRKNSTVFIVSTQQVSTIIRNYSIRCVKTSQFYAVVASCMNEPKYQFIYKKITNIWPSHCESFVLIHTNYSMGMAVCIYWIVTCSNCNYYFIIGNGQFAAINGNYHDRRADKYARVTIICTSADEDKIRIPIRTCPCIIQFVGL